VTKDLSTILGGWDYDASRVNARWVTGVDGLPKIQLRLDLGVLQMEMEGRPDGQTPHGYPSLLDYYRALETEGASHPALRLREENCTALQHEAVQYYYRYLAFYALGHLEGVVRDTEHNLEIFELVAHYAVEDELAWQFLQFFPYVRMMNARVIAEQSLEQKDHDTGIQIVEEAIKDIREFLNEYAEYEEDHHCEELELLTRMLEKLKKRKPRTEADCLQEDLDQAVAAEDYERAAVLRDALKKLQQEQMIP